MLLIEGGHGFDFLKPTRMLEIKQRVRLATLAVALLVTVFPVSGSAQDASTQELQARFDEAMAAIEAQRYNEARGLLTALLSDYPTLQRARLDLARAHYMVADFENARREVEEVLEDPNTPPGVRTTLLAGANSRGSCPLAER